jgi:hypothetical protein
MLGLWRIIKRSPWIATYAEDTLWGTFVAADVATQASDLRQLQSLHGLGIMRVQSRFAPGYPHEAVPIFQSDGRLLIDSNCATTNTLIC